MKQITAVEWLVEQLRQLAHNPKTHLGIGDIRVTQGLLDELEEQAKAMEKERFGETWDAALGAFDARGFNRVRAIVDFDDYYNETYGK